jgi:hypothetical protein
MPFPTPDPSASLTPWQGYLTHAAGYFADLGQLGYVALVTGLGLLAFVGGALLVTTLFRSR